MKPVSIFAAAVAALIASASALAGTPRATVGAVATAIEQQYFDEARAGKIARDLRAAAKAGAFDRATDPLVLATALTARLAPLDAHFNVSWRDPSAKAEPEAAVAPAADADPERRIHYGVRRVEVLAGNVGYLDLRMLAGFEFGSADQPARLAIEAALRLLSTSDAMILDLRAAPGGSPAMVGYLASAFLARGAEVFNTFHGRGGRTMSEAPPDWYAHPRTDVPLFVLTSRRTGSAAEALAYTLQSAGRATVVGERSYGAANPGDELDVGDGFRVFVSVATPVNAVTRTNWEGRGVIPDRAVPAAGALDAARRLALEKIVAGNGGATDARWALDALLAQETPVVVKPDDYVGSYGEVRIDADAGQLRLRRGERPASALLALGGDVFGVVDDTSRRVTFRRGADGAVLSVDSVQSDGASTRYLRQATR